MAPLTIAVAGKGGTGKTTISGMLVEWLIANGKKPVLAVDADPNSNLNEVLGLDVDTTLGDIRETIAHAELDPASAVPSGMTKQEYAEFMFAGALVEADDYDLLVMGRTQGKGCYCYVNGVLKSQIEKYMGGYRYLVVDNEAGMEHISRGTLPKIDVLLLVSDCSRRGIQAVGRIAKMVEELGIAPPIMKLIVNRAPNGVAESGVMEEINNQGLELLGVLPQDETVYRFDCDGKPTSQVPDGNPVKQALDPLFRQIIK